MLRTVRKLVGEQIARVVCRQVADEGRIGRQRTERRVVVLRRGGKRRVHHRVTGTQQHDQLGGGGLGQRAIGPRIRWPPAVQIDVRRDQTDQVAAGGRSRQATRSIRGQEVRVEG